MDRRDFLKFSVGAVTTIPLTLIDSGSAQAAATLNLFKVLSSFNFRDDQGKLIAGRNIAQALTTEKTDHFTLSFGFGSCSTVCDRYLYPNLAAVGKTLPEAQKDKLTSVVISVSPLDDTDFGNDYAMLKNKLEAMGIHQRVVTLFPVDESGQLSLDKGSTIQYAMKQFFDAKEDHAAPHSSLIRLFDRQGNHLNSQDGTKSQEDLKKVWQPYLGIPAQREMRSR